MSDLSELFARDPLGLSSEDVSKMVARLREWQAQAELGVKPKAEPKPKSTKTIDLLKDLGLT